MRYQYTTFYQNSRTYTDMMKAYHTAIACELTYILEGGTSVIDYQNGATPRYTEYLHAMREFNRCAKRYYFGTFSYTLRESWEYSWNGNYETL